MFKDLINALKQISIGLPRPMKAASDSKTPPDAQWRTTEKGDHILIENGKVVSKGVVSDWIRQKQSNIQNDGVKSTNNGHRPAGQIADASSQLPSFEKSKEILGRTFNSIAIDEAQLPADIRHEYAGTTPSKEDAELSMRKTAAIVSDIASRFPNNMLGLDKCVFYPALFNNAPAGTAASFRNSDSCHGVIAIPARMSETLKKAATRIYKRLENDENELKPNVQFYYPIEMFTHVSALHELAHSFFERNAKTCGFEDVLAECYIDYSWKPHTDLSSYCFGDIAEAHSECVAMVACPKYKIGTLPEPMERYVFETVLGCKAGSWNNKE